LKMLKVGITGGIGSGKSTVTNMLKEKHFSIIDADVIAREVFILNPLVLIQIKEEFGQEFFNKEGKLNRKELGNYIFKNDLKRKKLEGIIMPFIINEINHRLKICAEDNCKLCFLDAPTLIENNLHTSMDVTILVWVPSDLQVQRIIMRDALTLEGTLDRIKAQMPIDEKKKYADYIIDNSGSIENTKLQVDFIIMELERLNVKK